MVCNQSGPHISLMLVAYLCRCPVSQALRRQLVCRQGRTLNSQSAGIVRSLLVATPGVGRQGHMAGVRGLKGVRGNGVVGDPTQHTLHPMLDPYKSPTMNNQLLQQRGEISSHCVMPLLGIECLSYRKLCVINLVSACARICLNLNPSAQEFTPAFLLVSMNIETGVILPKCDSARS